MAKMAECRWLLCRIGFASVLYCPQHYFVRHDQTGIHALLTPANARRLIAADSCRANTGQSTSCRQTVKAIGERWRVFTGTDRSLLRSVLGPWSRVPKCEAPGPRRQTQNPLLQKSSPFRHDHGLQIPRLRYSPGLVPTTRLNALLNAASDS
jgi:hypothetical protein